VCCRAHTKGITCVEVVTVNQRLLLATASDLSVRLWTIQGQFLSIFGQPGLWTHLGVLETAPLIALKKKMTVITKQPKNTSLGDSTASANTDQEQAGTQPTSDEQVVATKILPEVKEIRYSIASSESKK